MTRAEFEIYSLLTKRGGLKTKQIAEITGRNQRNSITPLMQQMRRKGLVEHNGQRGVYCEWHACARVRAQVNDYPGPVTFDVHRELHALGGYRSPREIAALLDESLEVVTRAMSYLQSIRSIEEERGRYMVRSPEIARPRQIRAIVERWHDRRSEAERQVTAEHSLEALITDLCELLA